MRLKITGTKIRKQKKYKIAQMRKRQSEYIVDCLHLPRDVFLGAEFAQLSGNQQMHIRNFKRLLVCTEAEVVVLTARHKIYINGNRLIIAYLSAEEVKVTGCIKLISYEDLL